MQLEFRSLVGHQPTFFVPDTGTPGGHGVLTCPDGSDHTVVKVQTDPKEFDWPAIGITASRMGFECPVVFIDPGVHILTVTQDTVDGGTVVDVYLIDVYYDLVDLVDHGALGEAARLNQLRSLTGRKPFDYTADATADGYTDVELSALNRYRARKGFARLEA
jgi:hypothetical protein